MTVTFSNVYVERDDNMYMQCFKQPQWDELIEHQLIVFFLLK